MRRIGLFTVLLVIFWGGATGIGYGAEALSPVERLERGDFRSAADGLEQELFGGAGQPAPDSDNAVMARWSCPELERAMLLAYAYQEAGFPGRGLTLLDRGRIAWEACGDFGLKTRYFGLLAELLAGSGADGQAKEALQTAQTAAEAANDPELEAILDFSTGRIWALQGDREGALGAFADGLSRIEDLPGAAGEDGQSRKIYFGIGGSLQGLNGRLRLLRAQTLAGAGDRDAAVRELTEALQRLARVSRGYEKGEMLIAAALLAQRLGEGAPDSDRFGDIRYRALEESRKIAEAMGNPRLAGYALGHLGSLYQERGRFEDALLLTRKAIFSARQWETPESLYLWQWQLGRLFEETGDPEKALAAYSDAAETLHPIRGELLAAYRGDSEAFAEKIRPVYLGRARLLIRKAEAMEGFQQRQPALMGAMETMEELKTAELENFFHDPCVAEARNRQIRIDSPPSGVAVLYPIVFSDSVALLLALSDGIYLEKTVLDRKRLQDTVLNFRELLQSVVSGKRYFFYARRLQEWLIEPLASTLRSHNVRTLIVAPDGALRLIPFAALHDGKRFLARTYTMVTVPGLTLTDPVKPSDGGFSSIPAQWRKGLIAGLSEARFGFPPLPAVPEELNGVEAIIGGKVIQDEEYTIENLVRTFQENQYGVIHLATHGQFGGSARETFLLTSDGRLTMDRLEALIHLGRYRKEPVQLLALSACQTAMGDEQAALGLAGVAVKAGAKSALATLWSVDDEATAQAVIAFYRYLMNPGTSKAEALGLAQSELIQGGRYAHPAFWAPFLLIGNPS